MSAQRKKASKRPTTRAGRAAARRKVDPALLAAVGRAASAKGSGLRETVRERDAHLTRRGASPALNRELHDHHVDGNEIKPGLGGIHIPESLTAAEIHDLRCLVKEHNATADRYADKVVQERSVKATGPGRIVATEHAPGLLASVLDQLNVTHSRIRDLTMRVESIADVHCGPDGKASGTGGENPSPSGRAYELLGASSSIHRALDALTEQVDRLNLL